MKRVDMNTKRTTRWAFSLLFLALLLAAGGCHSFQEKISVEVMPEDDLYRLGMQKFEAGEWNHAIAVFERFERLYVNSERVQEIRLKRADAYFNKDRRSGYILAKSDYQSFISLYPRYDDSAYVWKQVAICSFKQILPPNRDQTQTEESIKDFQTFLQKYPESKYVPEVRSLLQEAYTHLAEHHIVVGMHYMGRKMYAAAGERFKSALELDVDIQDPEMVLYNLAFSLAKASEEYGRIHDFAIRVEQLGEVDRYRQRHERALYEAKQYLAEFRERFPKATARIATIERAINEVGPITEGTTQTAEKDQ